MKINSIQLGEALLLVSLDEFQSVPSETEIEHKFSRGFQEKIQSITKKSESVAWRVWQAPLKRAVLIAVLIMVMLVTVACAMPDIRNAIIDFFFVESETDYGITFDPDEAANAPCVIENVYIPVVAQEGYTLSFKECTNTVVEYIWTNDRDEYIHYWQTLIQENATDSTWIGIDAEGTKRTTQNINGYLVEIFDNESDGQYFVVWTDNRYIYGLDISVWGDHQETILKAIMDSLVEVETIN